MRKLPLVAVTLAAGLSCAPPPPAPAALAVRVLAGTGEPVARAGVFSGSTLVAVTDDEGLARIEVSGSEGEMFQVEVKCPPGFRSPTEPLVVRRLGIAATAAPEYRVTCQSTRHNLVIAVRAEGGADLPLLYLGKEIARTDRFGAANVMLEMDVGDRVELTLGTDGVRESDKLHPQNPVAVFEMPDREDVQLFPVTFTRDKKKAPKVYRPRGPKAF